MNQKTIGHELNSSEAQLGEEPTVLARLEALLEELLHLLQGGLLLGGIFGHVSGHGGLKVHLQVVASGHQVVVVDNLDEGLDLRPLLLLLHGVLLDYLRTHANIHSATVQLPLLRCASRETKVVY